VTFRQEDYIDASIENERFLRASSLPGSDSFDELAQLGYLFNCPSFIFAGRSAPPQLVRQGLNTMTLGG